MCVSILIDAPSSLVSPIELRCLFVAFLSMTRLFFLGHTALDYSQFWIDSQSLHSHNELALFIILVVLQKDIVL